MSAWNCVCRIITNGTPVRGNYDGNEDDHYTSADASVRSTGAEVVTAGASVGRGCASLQAGTACSFQSDLAVLYLVVLYLAVLYLEVLYLAVV